MRRFLVERWMDDLGRRVLVVFEGGESDLRTAGIGSVNGSAIVAESFRGETLGVPGGFGPFCPGVSIEMEGYALDPQSKAPTTKLLRPVRFVHCCQAREERSPIWEGCQELFQLGSQAEGGQAPRIRAPVRDHSDFAIHILGLEVGDVGLGATHEPAHFVEGTRDLEVDLGLALCLAAGTENTPGLRRVGGVETLLPAGDAVMDRVPATGSAAEQSETLLHGCASGL